MKKSMLMFALVALAGCATVPKPSAETGATITCSGASTSPACERAIGGLNQSSARLKAIQSDAASAFAFRGRIAISQGSQGGNAGIAWDAQSFETYQVELSAPVTSQSWQLEVTPAGSTVLGMKGGPRSGRDPVDLLKQATGWTIPVDDMRYWVHALPSPAASATAYVFSAGAAPRVIGFTQSGWTLKFEGGEAGGPPQRIFARNGTGQVRLVIDSWLKSATP